MKDKLEAYLQYLRREERSRATRQQYRRDILRFLAFLGESQLTKEQVIEYKERLQRVYQPASVNAKLVAVNGFLTFLGQPQLRVRQLKIQKKPYCPQEQELSREEYRRLVTAAQKKGDERLALLVQTICATGIRVSELRFITAEAVAEGEAEICLKGKSRTVLIGGRLRKALKGYLRRRGIFAGPVFLTRSGRPLDRTQVWKMMKALCKSAGVGQKKVFPHNLRHLFARCFYAIHKDIARLADVLGHSSLNTTRIYLVSVGEEHRKQIDALRLVLT